MASSSSSFLTLRTLSHSLLLAVARARTGDDDVSIVAGSRNIVIRNVLATAGHGMR